MRFFLAYGHVVNRVSPRARASSGERTPVACWLRHSAATNFPCYQLNSLRDNITKVRDGRMPSPARYKRALPRNRLRNKVPLASVNLIRNVVTSPSMPFTTREIESPDPVTRVAAADAALREPGQDDIGEKMVLNMGPSHPATHGVLRLVLELDGEIITKATPDIGFLHRGDEKIAENMQYNQFVPYTDRLDYLAPLSNNVAYALAVEKLMGWDIPPRGKAIRTICCETSRISSHLLGLGAMALDLGAMSVFLYTFTEREKLYNLFRAPDRRPIHHILHPRRRTNPRSSGKLYPATQKIPRRLWPESRRMRQVADPEQDFCRSHKRHRRHHEGARDRVCDFRAEPAGKRNRTRFAPQTSVSRLRPVRFRRGHRQRGRLLRSLSGASSRRCVRAREFCGRSSINCPAVRSMFRIGKT